MSNLHSIALEPDVLVSVDKDGELLSRFVDESCRLDGEVHHEGAQLGDQRGAPLGLLHHLSRTSIDHRHDQRRPLCLSHLLQVVVDELVLLEQLLGGGEEHGIG
jgi:hypothetical protein